MSCQAEEGKIETEQSENVAPPERRITAVDWAFLKGFGDITTARNTFFAPFFGVFLAFVVAKTDYIIGAGITIQIETFITFSLCVLYAWLTTSHLVLIETLRFIGSTNAMAGAFSEMADKDKTAFLEGLKSISEITRHDGNLFKWSMRSLWFTTGTVLLDLFFAKWALARLAEFVVAHRH